MVRVRKGVYRVDNLIMVPNRNKKDEIVPYHLGSTQPRGHGFQIRTKYTMAHIRLTQINNKKTSMLDGFNMKYITYGLIAIAVVFGIIAGIV